MVMIAVMIAVLRRDVVESVVIVVVTVVHRMDVVAVAVVAVTVVRVAVDFIFC